MSEGVDYSFSAPSAAGLAAAGKTFAGRYVGPGSGKFLTPGERDALFAHGIDVFLLAEGAADSAAGGYTIGVQHAQMARNHARELGAPDSAVIYFAVDYDVASKNWAGPREYLRGACDVLGRDRVGVYGEYDVMVWAQRDAVAAWFFQTYAWSYGQWFDGNHVEQYLNGVELAGAELDLCRSKVPYFGQWLANGRNPDQVFTGLAEEEEDDMKLYLVSAPDDPGIWLSNGLQRRAIQTQAEAEGWLAQGAIRYENVDLSWYGPAIETSASVVMTGVGVAGVLVPHIHAAGETGPAQPE